MIIDGDYSIKKGPFEDTFESLHTFQCPEWYKDAKFGIWSHWGPQSVTMFGDWYARQMYEEGSPQYLYHTRKYGHPSEFGYKDIIKLWKAEKFDPASLMDLYVKAGAKFFISQAMHHDNFDNFDSKYQPRFNSTVMGPKKDIVMAWKEQAERHGLPFGVSEHLSASYGWFATAKGCDLHGKYKGVPYDGCDPEYADLYFAGNNGHRLDYSESYDRSGWFTQNEEFQKHWLLRIKDLIDKAKPDLLYSDGGLPFMTYHNWDVHNKPVFDERISEEEVRYGLRAAAHLYNTSYAEHGHNRAVFAQKMKNQYIFSIGVLDIERSQEESIAPYHWQSDTSIGDWFYDVRDVYKPWNVIVESLIDVASKNGCLLLSVNQKPDGTLDYECEYTLQQIVKWMAVNGEGIFGSRPFRVSGEGETNFIHLKNLEEKAVSWQPGDVRYTKNDASNTVYAYLMRKPFEGRAVLRELNSSRERVKGVCLLGGEALSFEQNGSALVVSLPDKMPCEFVNGLKINLG